MVLTCCRARLSGCKQAAELTTCRFVRWIRVRSVRNTRATRADEHFCLLAACTTGCRDLFDHAVVALGVEASTIRIGCSQDPVCPAHAGQAQQEKQRYCARHFAAASTVARDQSLMQDHQRWPLERFALKKQWGI